MPPLWALASPISQVAIHFPPLTQPRRTLSPKAPNVGVVALFQARKRPCWVFSCSKKSTPLHGACNTPTLVCFHAPRPLSSMEPMTPCCANQVSSVLSCVLTIPEIFNYRLYLHYAKIPIDDRSTITYGNPPFFPLEVDNYNIVFLSKEVMQPPNGRGG